MLDREPLRQILRPFYYFILRIYLSGNTVSCPICRHSFHRFKNLNYERKTPLGNVCPSCFSFERHRLLWLFLRDKTDLFSSQTPRTLFHIAPEPCLRSRLSKLPHIGYRISDFQSHDRHERIDITATGLPDDSFDIILCCHVLEHIPNDKKAMRELLRVLKPGGWAIINVPVDYAREKTYEDPSIVSDEERKIHFGLEDHVRVYGRDYPGRLAEAGFLAEETDYVRELGMATAEKHVLLSDEMIYFCKKTK